MATLAKGVTRVAEGHYVVRWTDTDGPHKKNFRRPRDGRTDAAVRTTAEQFKQDRESGRRRGDVVVAGKAETITIGELAERWLAREGLRPATVARDRSLIDKWLQPKFLARRVGDVTRADIKALVRNWSAAGLKASTVRSYYARIAALFAFAVDDEIILRSPCRGVVGLPADRGRRERPVVGAADVHRLADAHPDPYRPVPYLAALGLRRAEVFGLQVRDLDLDPDAPTLTVRQTAGVVRGKLVIGPPKTEQSRRVIELPIEIGNFLRAHLHETGRASSPDAYVLQAPKGGPVRADLFRRRVWVPACERAGLAGLGLHDLRHAAVAMMSNAGVPVEVASKRVGHSTIRTTVDIYGSLPEEADRKAANKLGALFREAATQSAENRPVGGISTGD